MKLIPRDVGRLAWAAALVACAGEPQQSAEVPESEISASVPALDAVHDLVRPLWHDAFPQKDYDAIRELIPQLEERLGVLEAVELPGILREKEDQWVEGRERLLESFAGLKAAAAEDDQDSMLGHTEAFHLAFESLVRVIRPVVPELEAFHQEMYKLYHYYMPAHDVDRIRETTVAMQEKLIPLGAVRLAEPLSDKQEDFEASVAELSNQVQALAALLESADRDAVNAAIESVHAAYQTAERIFD